MKTKVGSFKVLSSKGQSFVGVAKISILDKQKGYDLPFTVTADSSSSVLQVSEEALSTLFKEYLTDSVQTDIPQVLIDFELACAKFTSFESIELEDGFDQEAAISSYVGLVKSVLQYVSNQEVKDAWDNLTPAQQDELMRQDGGHAFGQSAYYGMLIDFKNVVKGGTSLVRDGPYYTQLSPYHLGPLDGGEWEGVGWAYNAQKHVPAKQYGSFTAKLNDAMKSAGFDPNAAKVLLAGKQLERSGQLDSYR